MRRYQLLLGMSILFLSLADAQLVSTTSLVGNVTDASGAPIESASIVATNTETHEAYTAATNTEGYYGIQFIKSGTYAITASRAGLETFTKAGVLVQNDQIVRTDFVLAVGRTTQRMTVVSEAAPLATDEANLRETINTRQTEDLPVNGRDALRLAVVTASVLPGMKDSQTSGSGEDFIAAGSREIQNNISLDGVSIMNNIVNLVTFKPSVDAIATVDVQIGTYQAQYGDYLGLQMNLVTKSGTNQLHGSVFEFLRNDDLDAKNFFQSATAPKAPFHQNQFGFELGGPVIIPKLYNGRNKTFFMIDYEALRELQYAPTYGTVLTPLMRQGNFSEYSASIHDPLAAGNPVFPGSVIPPSLLSSQAMKLLQYEPLPNLPGIANNLLVNVLNPNGNGNQTIDRIDQSFGQNVRLFFRDAWYNTTYQVNSVVPSADLTEHVIDHNYVVGYVQVLSPNIVNEFHFGHQLANLPNTTPFQTSALATATNPLGIPGFTSSLANPGLPSISITGFTAPNSSTPSFEGERAWQGTDLLSWMRGAHSMSMGFDIDRLSTQNRANNTPVGAFTFSGTITGFAPADFMFGLPLNVTTEGPAILGDVAQYRDGFFFVDKWQVTPKLTMSLGLRYELPTVPHSVNGEARELNPQFTALIPATLPKIFPYINPNHKDFAPRFGFAYRVTNKWVVRGGYGIYYNPNQLNSFTLLDSNPPLNTFYTYTSVPSNPTLSFSNPTPASAVGVAPAPNVKTDNPHLPTAYMQQWSLDVERSLWTNAALDVQYLGSHTVHLDRNYYPNTPLEPGPGSVISREPYPMWGVIREFQDDMVSSYNGMNVILRQNLSHGLTMLLSYTWSHDLDVTTDSNGADSAPMNPYNWRADYGNSNWDVRNRFVASYVYQLPFLRNSSSPLLRYALGNWQVNGIITAQTGFPINMTVPGDPANTGSSAERPNIVGTPSDDCGDGHLTNCILASAFALPATYTYGNAGRDILHGPDLVDIDFSLFKNFPIRESANFQIRGEFFNVLNHPSFSMGYNNPSAVLGTTVFGTITSTSDNNRQIQIAAKITF